MTTITSLAGSGASASITTPVSAIGVSSSPTAATPVTTCASGNTSRTKLSLPVSLPPSAVPPPSTSVTSTVRVLGTVRSPVLSYWMLAIASSTAQWQASSLKVITSGLPSSPPLTVPTTVGPSIGSS